jgi:hypothetical protein
VPLATSGVEYAYPSAASEFTPSFRGVRVVARSFVFYVVICYKDIP